MDIKKEIEKLQSQLENNINERNFCNKKANELAAQINYLSGKIDILKEMMAENESK